MKNILYEETPMKGEFPRYRRPRPRRSGRIVTFVILIPIIFVLIMGGLGVAFRLLNPTPVRTTTETRTFKLGAGTHPLLIVTNDEGFVHVRPGHGNTITITTTKVGDSFGVSPDDFKVNYTQSDNTITIHVKKDGIHLFDFSQTGHADLDVTLPVDSDLQLATDSGDIAVTGIHGKMTLSSNSGSSQATDVLLERGSQLSADSGNVTMSGSLGASRRYLFQSNSGAVAVTLPRGMSFHGVLTSNSGTITNDFPIARAQQPGTESETESFDVGSSPQATVTLQSDSGSLHLGYV
jgi:DUF4097 and DUF4098 domain-containing protein YvlB